MVLPVSCENTQTSGCGSRYMVADSRSAGAHHAGRYDPEIVGSRVVSPLGAGCSRANFEPAVLWGEGGLFFCLLSGLPLCLALEEIDQHRIEGIGLGDIDRMRAPGGDVEACALDCPGEILRHGAR